MDIESIIKENRLINVEDIRVYHGILTGKTVKPIYGNEILLNDFNKGDRVLVFNKDDFNAFLNDMLNIIKS